jgi:DNA-binding transcriptional LysR family regulator
MPFDPKQLRGFIAVADSGSIGMAAKAINITQPALSRIIRNMEDRHGVRLFERTSTGVVLSQAGEALMPHARMLLFELEGAADELKAFKGLSKGVVRVGAVAAVVETILAPTIAKLHASAPSLQIRVMKSHDDVLFAALIGNEVDLVISADTHDSEQVHAIAECLFEDAYQVFCSNGHPLREQSPSLADILPGEWALPPSQSTPRKVFDEVVRRHGVPKPNVVVETISPTIMIACAKHSEILGWLPNPVLHSAYTAGFVQKLDIPELEVVRRFYLFRRSKGILAPAARAFVEAMPLKAKALTG